MKFDEKTLTYFVDAGNSNLTKKHYEIRLTKDYTYGLRKILSVKNKDLRLYFTVRPTFSDGKRSSREGNLKPTATYDVQIQFCKANVFADDFGVDLNELHLLEPSELKTFWRKVVDKCDLRFYSDDPSFYWQGFWEDLSNQRSAIKPFKGKHGTGKWRDIHQKSGGLIDGKLRVTKHITQILLDLESVHETKVIEYLRKHPLNIVQGVGEV